jgi:hypothetical protein
MNALPKTDGDAISQQDYWADRPSLAAPGPSRKGGRGLFAIAFIARGVLIDRACTVEIHADQTAGLDMIQPVGDFYFAHPCIEMAGLMAFGLMNLCNHSDNPNADIQWFKTDKLGWMADLVALSDINASEEITYFYKCPLWFFEKS